MDKRNIVLVVLDSVRARNFSPYGYSRDTSPHLSKLDGESITFTSAWSPGIWTLPSHVSMFTGYDVSEHEVTSPEDTIKPEETVFHKLSTKDYHTGVFSENTWLTEADVGLKDAFDTVHGKPSVVYPEALNPGEFAHRHDYGEYWAYLSEALSHEHPIKSLFNGAATKIQYDLPDPISQRLFATPSGEYYVNQFLEWSADLPDSEPWAACINLMDAHRPYTPDEEVDLWSDSDARSVQDSLDDPVWPFLRGEVPLSKLEKLEGLYDGGIRQCDRAIERLLESLAERGDLDETYVIITGDHGEGFGETSFVRDGEPVVEHKQGIHPVQTHVPLLVRTPSGDGDVVEKPVSGTRISTAIESMADGRFQPDVFESESVRISYTDASAQMIGTETTTEEAKVRSTVTELDGDVVKATDWDGRTAAVRIRNGQRAEIIDDVDAQSLVDDAFETLAAPDIGTERQNDLDEGVQQRLEELGYR